MKKKNFIVQITRFCKVMDGGGGGDGGGREEGNPRNRTQYVTGIFPYLICVFFFFFFQETHLSEDSLCVYRTNPSGSCSCLSTLFLRVLGVNMIIFSVCVSFDRVTENRS